MTKFLIGQGEDELYDLLVVNAENKKIALETYIQKIEVADDFVEYIQDCYSFGERFWYDEESECQESLPEEIIIDRVGEYFQEKPEFAKIYLIHWKNSYVNDGDCLMSLFSEEMLDWMWRKELTESVNPKIGTGWTKFTIIDLDEIKEIKQDD